MVGLSLCSSCGGLFRIFVSVKSFSGVNMESEDVFGGIYLMFVTCKFSCFRVCVVFVISVKVGKDTVQFGKHLHRPSYV